MNLLNLAIFIFFSFYICALGQNIHQEQCKWKQPSKTNTFHTNLAIQDCLVESSLVIQEKTSLPHNQGWSYCRYCRYRNQSIDQNYFSALESVDLSWSQWSDFFKLRNDLHRTKKIVNTTVSVGSILISNPIFVFPLIEYHPGHLLVDFMEQVYSSMLEVYGEVRMDALIVLDVSPPPRRPLLKQLLDGLVNSLDDQAYGYMIRWLTSETVLSFGDFVRKLETLSENDIIFSHIHFGGDISSTFSHLGTHHNPCQLQRQDLSLESFSQNYQRFHFFISSRVNEMIDDSILLANQPVIDVLFIYRNSSRSIVNMEEMIDLVSLMNLNWLAVDFSITPFKTQLIYLRKTRLLVAAAGTAIHNMIFLNRSASVIAVMMTDWCHCSWQYVNQGLLLGINVLTYCQPIERENQIPISHWTANFWLQCSGVLKRSDVTVDIKRFTSDLHQVFHPPPSSSSYLTKNKLTESWCDTGRSLSLSPLPTPVRRLHLPQLTKTNLTTLTLSPMTWKVRITGELTFPLIPQNIMSSFPCLSVCVILYFSDDLKSSSSSDWTPPPHQCLSLDSLNYYSLLDMLISSPTMTIHSWIQLNSHGGKITNSDNFLSIDLRIQESISRTLPEINLALANRSRDFNESESEIKCSNSMSLLVCSVEGIDIPLCVGSISSQSTFEMSLQLIAKELCLLHKDTFSFPSCAFFSSSLLETQLSLPHPQYLPTPNHPFIFLHIEETVGLSLRQYASLTSPFSFLSHSHYLPLTPSLTLSGSFILLQEKGHMMH
jgi:hypothetical protein